MIADLDPATGEAAASEVGGAVPPRRRRRRGRRSTRSSTAVVRPRTAASTSRSTTPGISPPDDDSIETTELPAWDRVQDVNLKSVYLCSRAALRHMVPQGRGLDHQHRVVRRAARFGDVADQLHRVEGRRARDDPRARRAVRASGHPRQRALPGPGEHAAAAGAVRQGPRARAAPARARADRAASPSPRSSPPRSRSSPATTRRSSPRPRSSSTAASPTPTSRRSSAPYRTPDVELMPMRRFRLRRDRRVAGVSRSSRCSRA